MAALAAQLLKQGAKAAEKTPVGKSTIAAIKDFFFGTKLRTGLTAGVVGLQVGSNSTPSYALGSPAAMAMANYGYPSMGLPLV